MNDTLRRAIFRAGLSEDNVAARLEVAPKTVRRWIDGRLPYPRHRLAMAQLLASDETDLWPELRADGESNAAPEDVHAIHAHRWSLSRDQWQALFASATQNVDILVYSGLFLAEDAGIIETIADRARADVKVRIAAGDPSSPAVATRGVQEGIDDAMGAKIRNALVHYRKLVGISGVDVRLHRTVLYNSLYRADADLLVNQHAYGVPAAQSPVLHLRRTTGGTMYDDYLATFERIWDEATSVF